MTGSVDEENADEHRSSCPVPAWPEGIVAFWAPDPPQDSPPPLGDVQKECRTRGAAFKKLGGFLEGTGLLTFDSRALRAFCEA